MATSVRLTYEDYLKLPDDGNRYELLDGELVVKPAPVPGHQRVVRNLTSALDTYFSRRGGGEVLPSPIDVGLAPDEVLQPDIIVVLAPRASIITQRRDEIEKRKLCALHGVTEYWVVDPVIESVKIYRRSGDAFPRVAEITTESGGAITTPLLPEFALDVARVFPQ